MNFALVALSSQETQILIRKQVSLIGQLAVLKILLNSLTIFLN